MSSLIMLSPYKTGKVVSAFLDGAKFKQMPWSSGTFRTVEFFGSRFFAAAGVSANLAFFASQDPDALGARINGSNSLQPIIYGIDYGGDDTIIAHFTSNPSNSVAGVWVSYDFGVTWIVRSIASQVWRSVAKGFTPDGTPMWMIGSTTTGAYSVSTDNGGTWTTRVGNIAMGALTYNPLIGKFQAVSSRTTRVSNDGGATATWATLPAFAPTANVSASPAPNRIFNFVHDRMIALQGPASTLMYSTDGIVWSEVTIPTFGSSVNQGKMLYADGLWVLIYSGGNAYAYSLDFINWQTGYFPAGFLCSFGAYGNGKFMFASNTNSAYYLTYDFAS